MGFLLKTAFWFSLVLLLLPLGIEGSGDRGDTIGPLQAIVAARDAVSDLSQMCDRKPEVCEAGRAALTTVGIKAREAARIALDLLGEGEADDGDRQPMVEAAPATPQQDDRPDGLAAGATLPGS